MSATIHVRVAAQKQLETDATNRLITCLRVFDENMKERSSAQRAKSVIEGLMSRMGVGKPSAADPSPKTGTHSQESSDPKVQGTSQETNANSGLQQEPAFPQNRPELSSDLDWNINDLDFDAVLQSFDQWPTNLDNTFSPLEPTDANTNSTTFSMGQMPKDDLYGFDAAGL